MGSHQQRERDGRQGGLKYAFAKGHAFGDHRQRREPLEVDREKNNQQVGNKKFGQGNGDQGQHIGQSVSQFAFVDCGQYTQTN